MIRQVLSLSFLIIGILLIFKVPRLINYLVDNSYDEICIGKVLKIDTRRDRRIVQRAEKIVEIGLEITYTVDYAGNKLNNVEYIVKNNLNPLIYHELKKLRKDSDLVLNCRDDDFRIKTEK